MLRIGQNQIPDRNWQKRRKNMKMSNDAFGSSLLVVRYSYVLIFFFISDRKIVEHLHTMFGAWILNIEYSWASWFLFYSVLIVLCLGFMMSVQFIATFSSVDYKITPQYDKCDCIIQVLELMFYDFSPIFSETVRINTSIW